MSEEMICYCFKYTAQDIREDARTHGKSTIMERIIEAKKGGACQCATRNPKGR